MARDRVQMVGSEGKEGKLGTGCGLIIQDNKSGLSCLLSYFITEPLTETKHSLNTTKAKPVFYDRNMDRLRPIIQLSKNALPCKLP